MISRRQFLKGFLALSAVGAGLSGYTLSEPFRLNITRYRVSPQGWPAGKQLKLAVIADLHACEPWMGIKKIERIVARTNALAPDAVLLVGDFVASHGIKRFGNPVPYHAWADALARLSAPLGVYAVMGNHDWWDDPNLVIRRGGTPRAATELTKRGITVLENDAVKVDHAGQPVWLAGLGSQTAFWLTDEERRATGKHYIGTNDLGKTLAAVTDHAPVVLMAHEPDVFPTIPDRVMLTVSGHTHGGQVRLFGHSPVVPSAYGNRFAYGHVVENERHLVVSGGLGCSMLPVRLGVPPEIVAIDIVA